MRWLEARCPALVAAALPVAVQLSEASQPVAAQPSETAEPVAAQHSEVSQPVAAQPPAESQHDTRHLEAAQAYAVKLPWFTPPCPSYERWLPHVCGPHEPLRQSRGSQRRVYLHASVCSGTGPESKIGDLTAQKHHSVFNCDQKAWAVKWQQDNNADRPDHFFSELRGLADLGQSIWTAEGTKVVLAQLIANGILQKPDHFHAGVSCRGYSFARSGRAADIWSHEDTFMIEEYLNLVELVESPVSTLENVGGFFSNRHEVGGEPTLPTYEASGRERNVGEVSNVCCDHQWFVPRMGALSLLDHVLLAWAAECRQGHSGLFCDAPRYPEESNHYQS